jgi:hypothetical protein
MDVVTSAFAGEFGLVSAIPPCSVRALDSVNEARLLECFEGTVDGDPIEGYDPFSPLENILMRERSARVVKQLQNGLPR